MEVSLAGISPCPRNGPCYKSKWNQLICDYKKIADFFARTGNTERVYWQLVPRSFSEKVFYEIHEPSPHQGFAVKWKWQLPCALEWDHEEGGSEPESEDLMDFADAATQQANDGSSQSASHDIGDRFSLPS